MPERLKYHFEPRKGWMNDPNGLCWFNGRYHAFFQHYPHDTRWGPMHWGHAVSEDLIHWEELDIALYPDMPYENAGGCFSGSAVVKDGQLYLFYTSVSKELGQTQSCAVSRDGLHFEKLAQNPPIAAPPPEGSADFRDPKVNRIGDSWYMVCGSGRDGVGKVLLYRSEDLLCWDYVGVLYESEEYGPIIECPDLFELDGQFVLMFSLIDRKEAAVRFLVGDFDGKRFTPRQDCCPEQGPQFYAPQTFLAPDGRRILIGWLYDWKKPLDEGADYAGALTIPRQLQLRDGCVLNYPVAEARALLQPSDALVQLRDGRVFVEGQPLLTLEKADAPAVFLRDTKTLEGFFDGGSQSFSYWYGK